MANKPVIEIDVDDAKFRRFLDLYDAYVDTLDEMPGKWESVGTAIGNAAESSEGLTGGVLTAKEALALAGAQAVFVYEALEAAAHAQKNLGDSTVTTDKRMTSLAHTVKGLGHSIQTAAGWVLRLGGGGLAAIGLGGLFGGLGIGALANNAFQRYKSSGQLGLTPGQLASAQVNLQPYLTTADLQASVNAQSDVTKQSAFQFLGIQDAASKNAVDLAHDELLATARAYKTAQSQGPEAVATFQQSPAFRAYSELGGNLSNVRLAAGDIGGLEHSYGAYKRDINALELSESQKHEWEDFKKELDKAGFAIETDLIEKLGPLTPKLTELTEGVIDATGAFLGSDGFKEIVKDTAIGLGEMGDFLTKDVNWKSVAADLNAVGTAAKSVAEFFGLINPPDQGPQTPQAVADEKKAGTYRPSGDEILKGQGDLMSTSLDLVARFEDWWADRGPQKAGKAAEDWFSAVATGAGKVIGEVAKQFGVDPLAALASSLVETGGTLDPRTKGDFERGAPTSFGLFQLHRGGELGDLSAEQAYDPRRNATIALAEFRAVQRLSKAALLVRERAVGYKGREADTSPGWLAALAQRPADPVGYAAEVNERYRHLRDEAIRHTRATRDEHKPSLAPKKTSMLPNVRIKIDVSNPTAARLAISSNALVAG